MINTPENINIFIAYTPTDRSYLEELQVHLSVLERLGLVDKIWYDGMVEVGRDWESTILDALHQSDIILLLVSADFIASDFCYHQEMQQAIRLHEEGKVHTIPIIVRPCLWERAPFSKLNVLPKGGQPLSSSEWPHEDVPYVQITKAVEDIILVLKQEALSPDEQKRHLEFQRSREEAEHYFAAGKWLEAEVKYQQALHFAKSESASEFLPIERRIEQCHNEIFFQRQLARAEEAFKEKRYLDARAASTKALDFKPDSSEAAKLKAATEAALASVAPKREKPAEEGQGTRFLQLKIFGIEVFKLVIAMSVIGLVTIPLILWNTNDSGWQASVEDNRLIYRDQQGQVVLRTNHPNGRDFSAGIAPVQDVEGKWGYINEENGLEIAFQFETAWPHSDREGLAYVAKGNRCGFIDREGAVKIPLTYLDAASFSEGLAMVKKAPGNFAFINAQGKEVIGGLDSIITTAFKNGEAIVIRKGRQITIDKKGRCVEGCKKAEVLNDRQKDRRLQGLIKDSEQLAQEKEYNRAVMKLQEAEQLTQNKEVLYDLGNRRDLIQRKVDDQHRTKFNELRKQADVSFAEGDFGRALKLYKAAMRLPYSGKERLRKRLRQSQSAIRREAAESPKEIYGFAHPDGQWGIKTAEREVLLPPQFDSVGVFSNGYLAIQRDGQWGFINEKGEVTIKPFYDSVILPFSPEGFAKVKKGRRVTDIDRHGRTVNLRE